MIGRVVSAKMPKTVTVLVESRREHPLYQKRYVWTQKYLVDDPLGAKLGDIVVFVKTRPISKRKHWQVTKVLGQDFVSLQQAELQEEAAEAIAEVLPEKAPEEAKETAAQQEDKAPAKSEADQAVPAVKKSRVKGKEKK